MKDVLAVIGLSLCLAVVPAHAVADCPPSHVSSSILVGDGSNPPTHLSSGYPMVIGSEGTRIGPYYWGIRPDTGFIFDHSIPDIRVGGGGYYFSSPWGAGSVACSTINGCQVCNGGWSATLFSSMGSFKGTVTQLPERT